MTAPTYPQIREAIRKVMAGIVGLHASAYWPGQVSFPGAWPIPGSSKEYETVAGDDALYWGILVLAAPSQPTDYQRGQELLDEYLQRDGPKSIMAAINANPRLGAVVADCFPTGVSDYHMKWDANGSPAWGAMINLKIMPT